MATSPEVRALRDKQAIERAKRQAQVRAEISQVMANERFAEWESQVDLRTQSAQALEKRRKALAGEATASAQKGEGAAEAQAKKQGNPLDSVGDALTGVDQRIQPDEGISNVTNGGADKVVSAITGGRAAQSQAPAFTVGVSQQTRPQIQRFGHGVSFGFPATSRQVDIRQNALTPGDVLRHNQRGEFEKNRQTEAQQAIFSDAFDRFRKDFPDNPRLSAQMARAIASNDPRQLQELYATAPKSMTAKIQEAQLESEGTLQRLREAEIRETLAQAKTREQQARVWEVYMDQKMGGGTLDHAFGIPFMSGAKGAVPGLGGSGGFAPPSLSGSGGGGGIPAGAMVNIAKEAFDKNGKVGNPWAAQQLQSLYLREGNLAIYPNEEGVLAKIGTKIGFGDSEPFTLVPVSRVLQAVALATTEGTPPEQVKAARDFLVSTDLFKRNSTGGVDLVRTGPNARLAFGLENYMAHNRELSQATDGAVQLPAPDDARAAAATVRAKEELKGGPGAVAKGRTAVKEFKEGFTVNNVFKKLGFGEGGILNPKNLRKLQRMKNEKIGEAVRVVSQILSDAKRGMLGLEPKEIRDLQTLIDVSSQELKRRGAEAATGGPQTGPETGGIPTREQVFGPLPPGGGFSAKQAARETAERAVPEKFRALGARPFVVDVEDGKVRVRRRDQ